jgi:Trk K+ transport system NAD-binding subunit
MHRIFTGDDGDVEAVELLIAKKCKCLDSPIRDLKIKKGILIGCVSREAEIIIPSGETQLQQGDSVIIISKNHVIRELDDILMTRTEVSAEATAEATAEAMAEVSAGTSADTSQAEQ